MKAAITALRHRAHTALVACALSPSPSAKHTEHFRTWQGYAKALRDVERGLGNRLAAKDAASTTGAYEAPTMLEGAIRLLGDDIERLTRAEVLQRVAQAGIEIPTDAVAGLDVVPATELEHSAAPTVHRHDEHATAGVVSDDGAGAHAGIVADDDADGLTTAGIDITANGVTVRLDFSMKGQTAATAAAAAVPELLSAYQRARSNVAAAQCALLEQQLARLRGEKHAEGGAA